MSAWDLLDSPVLVGDCVARMRELPADSIDAVVTDPPYGIGFMGHEWDQPGEYGAIRANGTPGLFASGTATPGPARAGVPMGQRRAAAPAPSGFSVHTSAKAKKLGQRAIVRDRAGAMEAGRYDLSRTANQRFQEWCEAWATEALRVLKPGGYLLVFGGTRTFHRMASGIEDAGFEVRDCMSWLFGSGFPKSRDVGDGRGTALKPAWEPIVVARKPPIGTVARNLDAYGTGALNIDACRIAGANPSPERRRGAVGHLAGHGQPGDSARSKAEGRLSSRTSPERYAEEREGELLGRWPANVALGHAPGCELLGTRTVRSDGHHPASRGDGGLGTSGHAGQADLEERHDGELVESWDCESGCPIRLLDEQTAGLAGGKALTGSEPSERNGSVYNPLGPRGAWEPYGDAGGASRFFYTAKASSAERSAGLDGFEAVERANGNKWTDRDYRVERGERTSGRESGPRRNHHPTVKPIEVMRWLVRLVTPPDGIVLDPFTGSGTTGCAAALEDRAFIGIERKPEYAAIARARIEFWAGQPRDVPADRILEADRNRRRLADAGQMELI